MTTYVAIAALVLAYLALVGAYCALRTLRRLRRATAVLARGAESRESILEATERHIELTTAVAGQLSDLRRELDAVEGSAMAAVRATRGEVQQQLGWLRGDVARSLRNVGLVRFDAAEDIAGEVSFALALLDDRGDGIALTAVTGRTDTRISAKGIVGGDGEQDLLPEERAAVESAMRQRPAAAAAAAAAAEMHRKAS